MRKPDDRGEFELVIIVMAQKDTMCQYTWSITTMVG